MLDAALSKRYAGTSEGQRALREAAIAACSEHLNAGLGDANLAARLCAADEGTYWQALSEVIVALQLRKCGIKPVHVEPGPDFLIEGNGQRIWIEVICPSPNGIPPDWLGFESGEVQSVPHEAMLLRWTAAIKEKAEKLIGPPGDPAKGYLQKGIVQNGDAYVVAVNARLLRSRYPVLEGVSQFPFAVEATFSVGPFQITINRETMETIGSRHQHRPRIPKPNGAQVPADTFLDPRFAPVSAVWATDMDECPLRDRKVPMAVVHNPLATTPVPVGFLPAQTEYVAASEGEVYRLDKVAGRCAADA